MSGQATSPSVDTVVRPGLPICLVTGFLGAGKTTLLNHILRNRDGLRAAVFVNEFGPVEIDSTLIKIQGSIDEDHVVTLDNGCICCEVNADLVTQLRRVLQSRVGEIDFIIIETSGVCDPAPVLATLERVDGLDSLTHIDSVIAVVDVGAFAHSSPSAIPDIAVQLGLAETALSQLTHADLVLINKCDLLGGPDSEAVDRVDAALLSELKVRGSQPPRTIRICHGAVDLSLVTALPRFRQSSENIANRDFHAVGEVNAAHGFSQVQIPPTKRSRLNDASDRSARLCVASHWKGSLRAHARSFVYEATRPFDPLKFEQWIDDPGPPRSICRAKGFLWMRDVPQLVIFQLAGKRTNPFETLKNTEKPSCSRIVFIGEASSLAHGDQESVVESLNACLC